MSWERGDRFRFPMGENKFCSRVLFLATLLSLPPVFSEEPVFPEEDGLPAPGFTIRGRWNDPASLTYSFDHRGAPLPEEIVERTP